MAKDNIDIMLANLIQENITKIKSTTPVNPPIKKDDEWRDEIHWDMAQVPFTM